jgi:hypothetical protein
LIHFASALQVEPLLIREHGRLVRKFWVWRCRDYLGP